MMKKIDLSIIIVTLNTRKYLKSCLDSLIPALAGLNCEVIVVDNVSSDGTSQMIKRDYSWVKYYYRNKVYGFGANNNFGAEKASGRFLLFLNSDTEILDKKIMKSMISWMDNRPIVGIVSPLLLNSDEKSYQGSGGFFPTLPRVFAWMFFVDNIPFLNFKSYHPKLSYFEKKHDQDWVTGAFFFMRKNVFDAVSGFDQDYDMYVEEVDLCHRVKKLGYGVSYQPRWSIVHLGQITSGAQRSIISELKNLVLFYKKHYPKWQLPYLRTILKLGCVLRAIIFGPVKGLEYVKTYAKALNEI